MKPRYVVLALIFSFASLSRTAFAQVEGFRLEGGPAFLTKSGTLSFSTGSIDSDSGYAIRGKLRYGFGALSLGAEVQASSQKYGTVKPNAPESLSATFVGATAALHPFSLAAIAPYAEVGLGKLFFSDSRITGNDGIKASVYGLGVIFGGTGRLALGVDLRLMRETDLQVKDLGTSFKYDPKLFSVLLSLKL